MHGRAGANHDPVRMYRYTPIANEGNFNSMTSSSFLDGQMLIAMPGMKDPRFERSLIFMCAHSESGAMGLIVNKVAPMLSFGDLLVRLDLLEETSASELSDDVLSIQVHFGGPVETGRGFVLHSADYFSAGSSLPISETVALTATIDILKAIAQGRGPERLMLALGYSGWAPGQLENEIQHNGWLHCPADGDLVFDSFQQDKYDLALRKIGVDPAMLSTDAGHG